MRRPKKFVMGAATCCAVACATLVARADARVFKVEASESKVQFVSDAPLERFTGASSRLQGTIQLDPEQPTQARADLKVPVSSIKTNNDLRDEHLQNDQWLDAARFPNITFTLTSVRAGAGLAANQSVTAEVRGKLSVHGVTRELTTTADTRFVPGDKRDKLLVRTSFDVKLTEHSVSVPSIVALKVAPVIRINANLTAYAEPAKAPASPSEESPSEAPLKEAPSAAPNAATEPGVAARKSKGAAPRARGAESPNAAQPDGYAPPPAAAPGAAAASDTEGSEAAARDQAAPEPQEAPAPAPVEQAAPAQPAQTAPSSQQGDPAAAPPMDDPAAEAKPALGGCQGGCTLGAARGAAPDASWLLVALSVWLVARGRRRNKLR